jgi:L-lactate dehydrogenase (cytochrome)/(S)-mandelate dehydrogenase
VLLDGGIRRGSDVVKALCLGATAVGIGRPYIYGLAARGGPGVQHVLEIMRDEIARVMLFMGVSDVSQLDRSMILPANQPQFDSPELHGGVLAEADVAWVAK